MELAVLERLWNNVQKPARYTGGELGSIVKDPNDIEVRFAFCFPDLYEIGMSHLGIKILYSLINERKEFWCERIFAPDLDMEELMRKNNVPLYGLESLDPIKDFDFIGFTLQYELSYTSILNMLDLAGVPLRSSERTGLSPLVVAGGPCACNPEPIADFFDLFILGEGEEVNLEIMDLYKIAKKEGWSKEEYLEKAAGIKGIYVPSLYDVSYKEDGTIDKVEATHGAPEHVTKRIIEDLDNVFYPTQFVVPYIQTVHDRSMVEVLRGCIRGCRFCQAGFIYRPFREKSHEVLAKNAWDLSENTGYDEVSLLSLSTSDYSQLLPLLEKIVPWTEEQKINISLPSLRIDNFSPELLEQIAKVRKSGLTFAPEAGTQRLRDVINKNISEDEVMRTCREAFAGGYSSVKLYFMMGLPTETMEDIKGIADLCDKIVDLYYREERPKGRPVSINISTACFVPKPFTPFEFEPQDTMEEFMKKQRYLKSCIRDKKIKYSYHDSPTSVLEAVLARGDRRLSEAVYTAWKKGSVLDGWGEHFNEQRWIDTFAELGIDPAFYANRRRSYEEISPWAHLDYSVTHQFMIRENEMAYRGETSPHCNDQCLGCGAADLYTEGKKKLPCR